MEDRLEICKKCVYFVDRGDVYQCNKNKRVLNFFVQHRSSVCPDNRWGRYIEASPPDLPRKAATLGKALLKWASNGFAPTPSDMFAQRMEICKACPEWDASGMAGTGRCKKCGCATQAKLRMATEKCPIDKWGPVTPSSPEQTQQSNTN
jgi:hypothetical protein